MTIINLTQHKASSDQLAVGVRDLPEESREKVCSLLTFQERPTSGNIAQRALDLAVIAKAFAKEGEFVMIGGAPWLMGPLQSALELQGVTGVYSFSQRKVVEKDGVKTSIFVHEGWIPAL